MKKCLLLIVVVLLSLPLMAQSKLELFGGYQYLHNGDINVGGQSQPNTSQGYNGWDVSARFNVAKFIGVEGDFSGSYANISGVSTNIYTYSAGPVVSVRAGGIQPFVHALVGGTRLTGSQSSASISTNGYNVMVGGGVDAKVNRLLWIRVGQVDWIYSHFSGFTVDSQTSPSFSGSGNVRIATGIVLHF
ncbi:MAG: hypothetical protein ABSF93_15915 [Candidatus Sulfotelmatobacter sp.]